MFEKLYLLVKNTAGSAVIDNPVIPAEHREAVINEASSAIIEILKGQLESGLLKDLIKYFQYPGIYNSPIMYAIEKRFSGRLTMFYGIETAAAAKIADELIPPVMQELIKQTKSEQNKEFALSSFLSKLNGNRSDMKALVSQMMVS
jgi:hypothetical protein